MLGALYPIPRYIPSHLATFIANLDYLSQSRALACFSTGHGHGEFLNYSPFPGVFPEVGMRVVQYEEGLRLILKLWTRHGDVNFKGKYYSLLDVTIFPKPVKQPHPLIWHAGGGSRTLKIAAKYCDGVVNGVMLEGGLALPMR